MIFLEANVMRFLPSLSFVALIAVGAPAAAQTQVQQQPTQVASANANAAVPEPATLSMLIVGILVVGSVRCVRLS